MKYINDLVDRLGKKGIVMEACRENEIQSIESNIAGYKLPEAYIEFLLKMGRGTENKFMRGDSCYFDEIADLNSGALKLLEENDSMLTLGKKDYVFWMSQGCMFCFFKMDEGDNPPVYFYNEEGEDRFLKISNTLTDFWLNRFDMKKSLFQPVD